MHVAIFTDQPIETLGGAQGSIRLQKKYLEKLGHTITVCTAAHVEPAKNEGYVALPSFRFGTHPNYRWLLSTKRNLDRVEHAFAQLPTVDVVHIQGEMWGAHLGYAYARHHDIPTVMTMHTNLGMGLRQVLGPVLARAFTFILSWGLSHRVGLSAKHWCTDPWQYLVELASLANGRIAPTKHFRDALSAHGATGDFVVIPTGCDDEVVHSVTPKTYDQLRFVWAGRMSPEKRLMDFVKAASQMPVPSTVAIYGIGQDRAKAERYLAQHPGEATVEFHGNIPYQDMLTEIASASALVQTSVGFETQGMSVYEAVTFGTPVLLRDPVIANELDDPLVRATENTTVEALTKLMTNFAKKDNSKTQKSVRHEFLQSEVTKNIDALYQSVIKP